MVNFRYFCLYVVIENIYFIEVGRLLVILRVGKVWRKRGWREDGYSYGV